MAYTSTLVKNSIMGNERVAIYNVTADAASGSVITNLGTIDAIQVTPISMATICGHFRINTNNLSAAANGQVFMSSLASADNFFLICYGKS